MTAGVVNKGARNDAVIRMGERGRQQQQHHGESLQISHLEELFL
jgi:hypothetical protein